MVALVAGVVAAGAVAAVVAGVVAGVALGAAIVVGWTIVVGMVAGAAVIGSTAAGAAGTIGLCSEPPQAPVARATPNTATANPRVGLIAFRLLRIGPRNGTVTLHDRHVDSAT